MRMATTASGPARERILIVEDNDEVRAVAVEHLTGAGYQVIACVSGAAAVSLLEEGGGVDLVFSDVVMPGGYPASTSATGCAPTGPAFRCC